RVLRAHPPGEPPHDGPHRAPLGEVAHLPAACADVAAQARPHQVGPGQSLSGPWLPRSRSREAREVRDHGAGGEGLMDARRRHVLAGAVALAVAAAGVRAAAEPRVIKVVARKFVFLPREIPLKKGEPVTIELTAPEVVMGFNAPDFKVRTD